MRQARITKAGSKVIQKMLDSMKQRYPACSYAWIDEDGRQMSTDGHIIFRLAQHAEVPLRPDFMPASKIVDNEFRECVNSLDNDIEIFCPTLEQVRHWIKFATSPENTTPVSRKNVVWDFSKMATDWHEVPKAEYLPSVPAYQLVDMLTVLRNPEMKVTKPRWGGQFRVAYFKSEIGECIILPLRGGSR